MGRKMYYDVEKGCGRMSNSNEVIRRNIRFVRTSLGMTQEQLAFASGMTTACVSRLERVNGNPTVQTLDQIADGLKLQTMRLFDEDLMSPENPAADGAPAQLFRGSGASRRAAGGAGPVDSELYQPREALLRPDRGQRKRHGAADGRPRAFLRAGRFTTGARAGIITEAAIMHL